MLARRWLERKTFGTAGKKIDPTQRIRTKQTITFKAKGQRDSNLSALRITYMIRLRTESALDWWIFRNDVGVVDPVPVLNETLGTFA